MHLSSHDSFHQLPPAIGSFNYLLQGGFSKFSGIYLNYSNDNIIMNNNFSKSDDGILLDSSNSNTVFNNTFSGYNLYSLGIGLKNSTNNLISDNTICNCPHGGIELGFASSNNIILNNTFKSCGLCVWRYEKNTVEGNTVNDKPLIYLENVSQIEINHAGQVILLNCEHIKVIGCNLSSASIGIDLLNSSNCVIENNICRDNFCGGIDLFDDSSNNIVLNNIIGNNFWGIFLTSYASNNKIVNNICENNYIGIDLVRGTNNNTIYLNNFISNGDNVRSYSSTNIWNSKEKITYIYRGNTYTSYLGNYWSDYTGTDANNNGIGDSPYSIDDRGGDIDQDYYPLMTWSDHYFNSLPHPLPLPPPTSTLTPAPRPTLTLTPRPTPTLAPRPTLRPTATLFEKIEGLIAAIRVGVGI